MKIRKIKYIRVFLAVLLALCIPLGVYAVKNGTAPEKTSGGYYSKTVNRVDFSLDATEFTCKKTVEGTETFAVSAKLTVRKCAPDLFAVIKKTDIAGLTCQYVLFSADSTPENDYVPENLVLRNDSPLSWTVEMVFETSDKLSLSPELQIEYTSGLTQDTADEYLLSIPLKIDII